MEHKHTDHKHSTAHTKKHMKIKKKNVWVTVSIILIVLLIISVYTGGFRSFGIGTGSKGDITKEEAASKSLDYINNYLLTGATATLKTVEENKGLYTLKLIIQDKEFDSYVTKDGTLLFPQGIDMAAEIEQPEQTETQAAEYPKSDTPNVKMFVMTFCPYGQQAESGLIPAADLLSEKIDFEPHFVIYSNYASGYPDYCLDEENKYCSMHGINELNEGVRQLCIWKYDKENWWSYVTKINEKCSLGNIEECWKGVAEETGIDADAVKTCEEKEAAALLANEVELNQKYEVRGSPSIFINDKSYSGARTPEDYKTSICSSFTSEPDDCSTALGTAGAAATGGCG